MGKKKRGHPDVEEILARPWCYYCERDFDDLKILISHQKAKHFKCERCGRRLNTAGGLSVHMNQVHKETLTSVDNALPNRSDLNVEIFGMEGIPEDIAQAHNQRIIQQFYQAEAERRAATGNPGPGNAGASGAKKPKFESPSELKKRLAEHKARMAEQAAGDGSSGANTPMEGVQNAQSPAMGHSPAYNGSPFPQPQSFGGTQGASHGSFSQDPYAQPVPAYQQAYAPPQPSYSPTGQQYPPQQPPYSAPQQYPPQQSFAPQGYGQGPPGFQGGPPPNNYGAGSPPGGYNPYQPPAHSPPQNGSLPARPPSLPPAPGLPQRPSFSGPPGSTYPPQPMHQGGPPASSPYPGQGGPPGWNGGWNGQDQSHGYQPQSQGYDPNYPPTASSVDELVSSASRPADDIDEIIRMAEAGIRPPKKTDQQAASVSTPVTAQEPAPAATPEVAEKKSKKDKPTKMIYSDNEVSPEEKLSKMPRYAFVPDSKDETALVEAAQPAVAGTVDE